MPRWRIRVVSSHIHRLKGFCWWASGVSYKKTNQITPIEHPLRWTLSLIKHRSPFSWKLSGGSLKWARGAFWSFECFVTLTAPSLMGLWITELIEVFTVDVSWSDLLVPVKISAHLHYPWPWLAKCPGRFLASRMNKCWQMAKKKKHNWVTEATSNLMKDKTICENGSFMCTRLHAFP